MAGLCKRWKLHAAVTAMPDDCDGVWSEACDGYGDNISADVDEVGNLCRLYKAAEFGPSFDMRWHDANEKETAQ